MSLTNGKLYECLNKDSLHLYCMTRRYFFIQWPQSSRVLVQNSLNATLEAILALHHVDNDVRLRALHTVMKNNYKGQYNYLLDYVAHCDENQEVRSMALEYAVISRSFKTPVILSNALCSVCRSGFAGKAMHCQRCNTPYHADCWDYVGKCSIYGCDTRL